MAPAAFTVELNRLLGLPTVTLDHPKWSGQLVLNGLKFAVIWHENEPLWTGIIDADQRARALHRIRIDLKLDVQLSELEHGAHW